MICVVHFVLALMFFVDAALASSLIGATVALASGGMELYDLPVACSLVYI